MVASGPRRKCRLAVVAGFTLLMKLMNYDEVAGAAARAAVKNAKGVHFKNAKTLIESLQRSLPERKAVLHKWYRSSRLRRKCEDV